MSKKVKNSANSSYSIEQSRKQRLLSEAIEKNLQDLSVGIQIYLKKFGVAEDRDSIEEIAKEVGVSKNSTEV